MKQRQCSLHRLFLLCACSRYASCLGYLQKLKPELSLDIHLHDHVDALYEQIRHKALIQYTTPFISVDLTRMAASFKTNVAGLEKELAALIMENQIQVIIRYAEGSYKRQECSVCFLAAPPISAHSDLFLATSTC